jgi:hypothetical protein
MSSSRRTERSRDEGLRTILTATGTHTSDRPSPPVAASVSSSSTERHRDGRSCTVCARRSREEECQVARLTTAHSTGHDARTGTAHLRASQAEAGQQHAHQDPRSMHCEASSGRPPLRPKCARGAPCPPDCRSTAGRCSKAPAPPAPQGIRVLHSDASPLGAFGPQKHRVGTRAAGCSVVCCGRRCILMSRFAWGTCYCRWLLLILAMSLSIDKRCWADATSPPVERRRVAAALSPALVVCPAASRQASVCSAASSPPFIVAGQNGFSTSRHRLPHWGGRMRLRNSPKVECNAPKAKPVMHQNSRHVGDISQHYSSRVHYRYNIPVLHSPPTRT